jgi:hypothetical protein
MDLGITKTRARAYFPFEMLEPLLSANLTSRQVSELIVHALNDAGLEYTCRERINFLTVAIAQPYDTMVEPYTLQDQVGKDGYVPGPDAISYHCDDLLHRDFSALKAAPGPPLTSDPALLYVDRGMRDTRAERHDHLESCDEARRPKIVQEKMGKTITDRLLLLCRASSYEDLPHMYRDWASRPRGISERCVFQLAVNAVCPSKACTPLRSPRPR